MCTGFAFRFEDRKWNRGYNGLHQLGQLVAPSILFPVFKSEGKPGSVTCQINTVSRSYHLFGLGQVSQNSVTYKLKCNSPLNGVRHRSLLVFFSLATNVNWFFMSDGCLSLVTVGHVDQRRTLVNALTFQL